MKPPTGSGQYLSRDYRYAPYLLVGFVISGFGAIALFVKFVGSFSDGRELWLQVMAAAVSLGCAFIAVQALRVRLRVDAEGVEVRNYLRTYRFRRDEVAGMMVVTRSNRPGLAVGLKDGRMRSVHALQGFRTPFRIDPQTHPLYRIGREIDALLGVVDEPPVAS